MTVFNMNCVDGMRALPAASVDSIVTDPPYELGFMGKSWDASGIAYSVEMWREALRVLKPGGHLLAFSGSRTYHRMTCAIEDAGFEIRDQIMWVYGSGFPKSLDVSKAIDKAAGAEREVIGRASYGDGHVQNSTESIGFGGCDPAADQRLITAPATEAAKQWQGWGTALKPAHEPICVARKPLVGTVAANVLQHGTGALNIDGCRVPGTWEPKGLQTGLGATKFFSEGAAAEIDKSPHALGRWPANLIHDGSDEVLAVFPQAPGQQGALTGAEPSSKTANAFGDFAGRAPSEPRDDAGSAARFFYCAKASRADRGDGNVHPTVKPTDLMRYLCRLVTPPGGTVLDPFTGSGSTGKAAVLEGFNFLGFELSPEYTAIALARINGAKP